MQDADDATLVLALRGGDPRAARMLWHRYATTVHRILRRTVGPSHDLEDLTQEVFLVVFKKANEIRAPKALRAYIAAVADLTGRHELRRRRARPRNDSWDAREPGVTVATQDTESRAALARLHAVLGQLHPKHRAAFVLRFIEQRELTQVAAALGVSLATAKRWTTRASAKMQIFVERDPLLAEYGAAG